jgi:EpsI family protein
MIGRRDILIGGACVLGAGGAWAMIPRRHVSLLGARQMDAIVPRAFSDWTSADTTDFVAPTEPGSLASRIYGTTIGRIYRQASSGDELMMLIAHGDTQSDDLMIHRPEICYPAFGYSIASSQAVQIDLQGDVQLPARALVTKASDRTENVLYWTRLGEYFPQNRKEQQLARLRTALRGEIGDGVLIRLTQDTADSAWSIAFMRGFASALVNAMAPRDRAALIGTARASAFGRAAETT